MEAMCSQTNASWMGTDSSWPAQTWIVRWIVSKHSSISRQWQDDLHGNWYIDCVHYNQLQTLDSLGWQAPGSQSKCNHTHSNNAYAWACEVSSYTAVQVCHWLQVILELVNPHPELEWTLNLHTHTSRSVELVLGFEWGRTLECLVDINIWTSLIRIVGKC